MVKITDSVPIKDKLRGDEVPAKRLWGIRAELVFRRLLAEAMKSSGKNRAQIARELSGILGRCVTKNMLDDCVRSRKKGRMVRFPAAWIPALCQVTGSDEPQRHLLTERLRTLLAVGEKVSASADLLASAQEAVAQIMQLGQQRIKGPKR
ncbi:MAG: hypothetical protein ABSE79_08110 [Terriglobia bacterium]|jgi:hypothetical protein